MDATASGSRHGPPVNGLTTYHSPLPNTTLYVQNLPGKLHKVQLRRQLWMLCLTYGRVLDVVATRAAGMREQAFVVFEDLASATSALRGLEGFLFWGKPLRLTYAKAQAKAALVWQYGEEAVASDPAIQRLMKAAAAKANGGVGMDQGRVTFSQAGAELQGRERKRAREEAGLPEGPEEEEEDDDEEEGSGSDNPGAVTGQAQASEQARQGKRRKSEAVDEGAAGPTLMQEEEEASPSEEEEDEEQEDDLGAPLPRAGTVPNNLLFVGDLPDSMDESTLTELFAPLQGCQAVQMLPADPSRLPPTSFAFVEFDDRVQAGKAIVALQGKSLPGSDVPISVAFAARAGAA